MSKGRSIIPAERRLRHCLNCDTPLDSESFCPRCGQENTDKNISLWTLIVDFFGDYFSFDSKFFNTFIPLLIFPGKVPSEFMDGMRVKYVPPLRSLIFTSFLFFLIWGWTFEPEVRQPKDIAENVGEQLNQELEEAIAQGDSIAVIGNDNAHLTISPGDSSSSTLGKVEELKDLLDADVELTAAVDSISTDNSPFEKKLYTQIGKMYLSDTTSIIKYFVSNFSVMILVVQPFLALLLKLLYIRKRTRHRFIEHIVFSLYYHSWLLIMAIVGLLLSLLITSLETEAFAGILGIIYLPMAVKRFYGQSLLKTAGKSFLLFILYLGLIMPLFMIISLALSFYFF